MKNLPVSVLIPTYNEEKNISNCLETMLDQDYPKLEIIVVDDGSTDKTKEFVKKFPVKLIEQNHQGPARARNKAAKEASGDILVFMDADMTFSRNFITDLVFSINAGKAKGTFSKEEYISNWENIWARCWNFNHNLPKKKMIPEDYPDEGQDFRAILKQEFLKVDGFSDTGYTDTWSLSEKLGYGPYSVRGAVYFHANPDNLREVFIQSKWVAKRNYKFGLMGELFALLRASLPYSLLIGSYKAIIYREGRFLIFKTVYDIGTFVGILEMIILGKLSK